MGQGWHGSGEGGGGKISDLQKWGGGIINTAPEIV